MRILASLRALPQALCITRPSATAKPRGFSSTVAVGRGVHPRQLPVLEAFCEYLEGRDLSGFSHRSAVFRDFMENAPPKIQELGVYVRAPSDLFYLYSSQLSLRFPEFWNMRKTPLTRLQPKRKGAVQAHLPIDMEILRAYLTFLRTFDWRRPVNRAVLRQEFTQSIPPGPMLTRIREAVSFWKNFERVHSTELAAVPEWSHLYNLRALHIVNRKGVVRKLTLAEQKLVGGHVGVVRGEPLGADFFKQTKRRRGRPSKSEQSAASQALS
ncbi:hypothetical protein CspeluHIS016_0303450 [Cutaneotrichosporon spelunceum]|uniref:Uncharacterized protein n=1 Tax=Cutaneotrichosporon spelunceum TaxID=1672016 RepID=A0AAD3TTB1_9TREE|nr:hypothetical protein CspeluHIS016_0303450 [Cutaneotrichosporon spelunceum]